MDVVTGRTEPCTITSVMLSWETVILLNKFLTIYIIRAKTDIISKRYIRIPRNRFILLLPVHTVHAGFTFFSSRQIYILQI